MKRSSFDSFKPEHTSKQPRNDVADTSTSNETTPAGPSTSTNEKIEEKSQTCEINDSNNINDNQEVEEIEATRARTSSFSETSPSSEESSEEDVREGPIADLFQLLDEDYDDENDSDWAGSIGDDIDPSDDSDELINTTDDEMPPPPILASFDTRGNSWEGPLKYKTLLTGLRIRKSALQNLRPLQLLCLQCVGDNINYFTAKKEPFTCLPASILLMLTKFLEKEDILINPQVLPHFITPRSEYLPINLQKPEKYQGDISCVFWTEDFTHLFKRMQQCKSVVKVLNLRLNHPDFLAVAEEKYPTLEDIDLTLSAMHNLQELTINILDTSDETLAIIAANCPELRKLDLDGNLKVSDKGIKSLCSKETSVCKNIEYLSLNETRVSTAGLMLALTNLSNLQYLYNDGHISFALRRYYATYGNSKPLKLASFKITPKFKKDLVHYCKLLQNCKELDITITPTFIAFSAFPNLVSLKYADKTLTNLNRFSYVTSLMFYKEKLTELDIKISKEVIDLSTIGYLCTNLEVFRFECDSVLRLIKREPNYIMDEKRHYTKLRILHLQFKNRQNSLIPYEVLKVMLSSKYLQNVTFVDCKIPDAVLHPLTLGAVRNTNIFSSLESIKFRSCELLYRRLKNLICVAPNLKKLCMIRCNDPTDVWIDMKDSIGWFLTQNRLKIELVFVAG